MKRESEPLEQRIEELLGAERAGMSEHALLRRLAEEGREPFAGLRFGDELELFRAHFSLFHALYRLQEQLRRLGRAELHISPLKIALGAYNAGAAGLVEPDPMRAFYLDRRNLAMDRSEVRRLLEGFRRRMAAADERQEALAVLELSEPVDFSAIKRRYRELAMRDHPDRGGNTASLQRLNRAMQVLERCYG